jgi:hypothetical protein
MDYSKGKVYKIMSHLGDEIYIGSTTKDYLSQRMAMHHYDYNYWKKGITKRAHLASYDIFDKYGFENCQIVLIETYPCISKDELRARESYYIQLLKCTNKLVPNRTSAESQQAYRDNHKDKIKEDNKRDRENNNDKILEHREKYKEKMKEITICQCGLAVSKGGMRRHFNSIKHKESLQILTVN